MRNLKDTVALINLATLLFFQGKLLSYRNQFIDLLCKSMDWFLYDGALRHERVKTLHNGSKNCRPKHFRKKLEMD